MTTTSPTFERLTDLASVDIAPGFFAITRSGGLRERLEKILLLGALITAAVQRSVLVGYVADLPFMPVATVWGELTRRWQSVPDARELGAIEVARPFRAQGIGRRLLAELVAGTRLDGNILIAEGLEWHWDLEARGLSSRECRARLLALFSDAGFRRYDTDEAEITYSAANFLLARIGPQVRQQSRLAFESALLLDRHAHR